jgi:hypothetical protein
MGSDPIAHEPSCKLEQSPFDHFVIGLHVHHLICMYLVKHGLDDMTPFHELKGYWIWVFFISRLFTFFNCCVNNHFMAYAMEYVPNLDIHFNPTLVHPNLLELFQVF